MDLGEHVDPWPYEVLRHEGFRLATDGDKLLVTPSEFLDADTREFIKANRAAIVETVCGVEALAKFMADWNRALEEMPRRVIGTERLNRKQ